MNINKVFNIKNNLKLIINKASIEDARPIINFLNKIGGETDFLTYGLNEFPFTLDQEEEIIKECLDLDNNLMIVGKINNEIVSQLFLQSTSKPRLAHIGEMGISVSKSFWNHSVAFYLLQTALEWAKSKNITKLQLQVREDNINAISLYKKIGFNIEGKIINAIKVNNEYYNEFIMGMVI